MLLFNHNTADEDWVCPACGNVADSDGFFPCSVRGIAMEPCGDWGGHYSCGRCRTVVAKVG